MQFEAYIVEDDFDDYQRLNDILIGLDVNVNSRYNTKHPYTDSVEKIKLRQPNLLVIDHELNEEEGKSGLSLFNEVTNLYNFTIFCSQYPEQAKDNDKLFVNAKFIEKHPIEQVLKDRFKMCLSAAGDYFNRLPDANRIVFDTGEEVAMVSVNEIIYLEANRDNTVLYSENRAPIRLKKGINSVYSSLNLEQWGFYFVSRSHIVNRFKIRSIRYKADVFSKKVISLQDEKGKSYKIPISKNFFKSPHWQYLLDVYKK